MTISPAKLCQIELPVADLDRAGIFYEKSFGWKTAPADMHQYAVLEVPEDCPFGISLIPSTRPRSGDSMVLYFAVENPKIIADLVTAHGGRFRFGPKKLGGYGEIWQVEDPDGNRFGLYCKP
jgi:predicted enzyme related to lactoylglutathione lyase